MLKTILKKYRKKHNISQKELAFILSSYHKQLYGIDPVTISRWENGRTKPNNKKIILILLAINQLHEYWQCINYDEIPVNFFGEFIEKRFTQAKLLSVLFLEGDIDIKNIDLSQEKYLSQSHKMLTYQKKKDQTTYSIGKNENFIVDTFLHNTIARSYSIHVNIDHNNFDFSNFVNNNFNDNRYDSIFIFDQLSISLEFFNLSFYLLIHKLINNHRYKYVYLYIKDSNVLSSFLKLGFNIIKTHKSESDYVFNEYHYIISIDSYELLSNRYIINYFSDFRQNLIRKNHTLFEKINNL
ncbi:TPA: helix-turn-helix domain-containing protein [Photobacterium damselae]